MQNQEFTAFEGQRLLSSGDLATVVSQAKAAIDQNEHASLMIFDNLTCRQVEFDFRGTLDEVLGRLPAPPQEKTETGSPDEAKVGRPKLGVVAREVTLLPRHWEWLATQSGGASVTLRKLVDEARRANQTKDRSRQAQEAINRFMMVMAGNFPGFEESTRALYRGDKGKFEEIIASWPVGIAEHIHMLAAGVEWETTEMGG